MKAACFALCVGVAHLGMQKSREIKGPVLGSCNFNNGKENGNYYMIGYILGLFVRMEKKIEITIL